MGRAMEIILSGRKVPADEALRIGACEHVVPEGKSREFAEAMAHEIARFPQACVRAAVGDGSRPRTPQIHAPISTSCSRSTPVRTPSPLSMYTTSSVATLPEAPAA